MESVHTIDTDHWKAAKRIFRAGVDLETEEWPGFLDRECGADKPLRRLVERLLASDRRAAGAEHDPLPNLFATDRPTHSLPTVDGAEQGRDQREPSIGQIVSQYLILERLGSGGMGVVFRARDIRLDRDVALKFLPQHLSEDAVALRHLIVEAQAAAALDDPHISTIFEVGGVESGNLFIAETYWSGETLAARLERGPLPAAEALDITAEIADGLASAHARGIVHRDIKPANLLLTDDGQVKILDFGIAQTDPAANRPRRRSTPGTRAYMSPEQIRGEPVDARTDIWSLGVVLYQMLAGRLPFTGRTRDELTHSILEHASEPIATDLSGASRRLDRLLATALRKNPRARFPHAGAMIEAIGKVRPESSGAARRTIRPEKTSSRHGFRPTTLSIAAMAMVASVLGVLAAIAVHRSSAPPARPEIHSIAVLPFVNLSKNSAEEPFVDGMTEALIDGLGRIRDLRVLSRTSSMSYRGSERTLSEIAHELNVEAVVEGSVMVDGDQTHVVVRLIATDPEQQLWTRNYRRYRRDLFSLQQELALAIASEVQVAITPAEERHLLTARRISPRAQELFLKARHLARSGYSEARTIKVYEMIREAIALEPQFPEAQAELANLCPLLVHFNVMSADEAYPRGQSAALAALERDPSLVAAHLALMRNYLSYEWDWERARGAILRGLESRPDAAALHRGYAWYLATIGQLETALVEIETASRLDPVSEVIAVDRVRFLAYAGRYEEAIARSREMLEMWPDSFGAHRFLGLAEVHLGRTRPGLVELRRAVEIGHSHPLATGELGAAQAISGATEEALETLSDLMAIEPPPAYNVAVVHAGLGNLDQALDWLERAYDEHSTLIPRLRVDPCLDPLRAEPRFTALLERVGLTDSQLADLPSFGEDHRGVLDDPRERPWSQGAASTSRAR